MQLFRVINLILIIDSPRTRNRNPLKGNLKSILAANEMPNKAVPRWTSRQICHRSCACRFCCFQEQIWGLTSSDVTILIASRDQLLRSRLTLTITLSFTHKSWQNMPASPNFYDWLIGFNCSALNQLLPETRIFSTFFSFHLNNKQANPPSTRRLCRRKFSITILGGTNRLKCCDKQLEV